MSAFSLRHGQDPLRPPEAPGIGRGFAFALGVHVLLVVALSAGVQWRTKTLPTFEAELWSAVPQAAAPKEIEPPEPELELAPRPQPAPPPQPAEDLQAERDAEIAIAKAREQKKREAEKQAELEAERKKQQALKDKAERERLDKLEKQRLADEKLKQDKADKARQDKLKQARQEKEADARREAHSPENIRRIQGMAGASGDANATGSALKSSGPSARYGGRIKERIGQNILYC